MEKNAKVTLRLTNSLQAARTVVLEPWTGEYKLRPGGTFDIVAEGNLEYPLQVELSEDRIIVYSFDSAGAQMSIFEDGNELKSSPT
jgi:hypothetical protein